MSAEFSSPLAAQAPRPRIVLAGTSSGVGKTTLVLAIARALRERGLRVALFKCGPDYLDVTYHTQALGSPAQNLDGYLMGRDAVLRTFDVASRGCDIALIEGVMGLFDGREPTSNAGSTAEIASWLRAPILLVTDASGTARSLAALFRGFRDFEPGLGVCGAIANRVGSSGHLKLLEQAMPGDLLGGFPREDSIAFAERHLGLCTASATTLPEEKLDRLAQLATQWIDLDRLTALAREAGALPERTSESPLTKVERGATTDRRPRIGLARDAAFHFYYADNLQRLEDLGATLVPFSPLEATRLPELDGLYIGGGYPELHARTLSENAELRAEIAAFAERGGPIYAECGGLMYLTKAIHTIEGDRYPMVGLFDTETHQRDKLQALGYVEVETREDSLLGPRGTRFRGHQFRYSQLDREPERPLYSLRRRRGEAILEGFQVKRAVASYVHAHWASNPGVARSFVQSCRDFANAEVTC
ncbi:MAG TPA: cobyrinate a,c-diamide synthase [Polyangiaceae bacterium]|nr:cobyrinate a,c-diamide synthase [Polyangiaceae bacterium]